MLTLAIVTPILVALIATPANAKTGGGGPGALVFVPNPVAETGNQSLTDQKDAASSTGPGTSTASTPRSRVTGSRVLTERELRIQPDAGRVRTGDGVQLGHAVSAVSAKPRFGSTRPAVNRRQVPVRINQLRVTDACQPSDPGAPRQCISMARSAGAVRRDVANRCAG